VRSAAAVANSRWPSWAIRVFAGGYDTVLTDERREASEFQRPGGALLLLTINHVRVAMAGDTHDFEYYREKIGADAARTMHHFITGGGGRI